MKLRLNYCHLEATFVNVLHGINDISDQIRSSLLALRAILTHRLVMTKASKTEAREMT